MPWNPPKPTGPWIVKGIPLDAGEKPGIRKELREFKQDKDMWNMYLLGLWQFQLLDMDHQLSYFQIAGIHGEPYVAWPPNDQKLKEIMKKQGGFCTHSSILFLTWHRPYLAVFESVLRDAMIYVANEFTPEEGRDKYLKAAKAFRMPFWDWARPGLPVFPDEAVDSDKSSVIMPESLRKDYNKTKSTTDSTVEIDNPLYSYKFQAGASDIFKISKLPNTTRYHSDGVETQETPEEQKKALVDGIDPYSREVNSELPVEGNLRERVVYLLKSYKVFDQVSHNQWDPDRVPSTDPEDDPTTAGMGFGSIEDIHNTLHVLIGGQGQDSLGRERDGQMRHVPISAFDPIFWLHHTNIDRIVSIWEGLHADVSKQEAWVTTKKSSFGSWVTAAGTDEGLTTPLAPFYKDATSFYTSDDVRETVKFGYAYPETQSWKFSSTDAYRRDIEKQLDAIYPAASLATMITASKRGVEQHEAMLRQRAKRFARIVAVEQPSTAVTALSLAQAITPHSVALPLNPIDVPNVSVPDGKSLAALAKDGTYLEWLVNIKAAKHTLGGSYLVHVFLGRVPEQESTTLYCVSPYHIGTFSPLGQEGDTGCGKCKDAQAAGMAVTGQIPLTIALAERYFAGELGSLSENDVVPYLQMHLHWEVVDKTGNRLQSHRDAVDGLLVGVISNKVTLSEHDFPEYSQNVTVFPAVTTRRDGSGRAEGTGVTEANKFFQSIE